MTQTVVAIHQPNFFPWLGYFDKIARCDRFVLLDHVQLPRGSSSWVNRTRMMVSGEPRWVTAPVQRLSGDQSIAETRFAVDKDWRSATLRTLELSYRKAPHFAETFELVAPLVSNADEFIAAYNVRAIIVLAEALGLDTDKSLRSSAMNPQGSATDLLLDLTAKAGGTAYLRGGGAEGYQQDQVLEAGGIKPLAQRFEPPVYPQRSTSGEFEPGLSVIDAMMNVGIAGTAALLRGSAS